MVLEIIGIVLAVIILSILINGIEDYCKQSSRVNMSFKEAMDLVELPVVTFLNGDKKLNFLLDTGSNLSQINNSILPLLDHKKIKAEDIDVVGMEGNKVKTELCEMTITYKGQEFVSSFCINDLDDAFAIVKEESGVQIHGILGSLFFQKYKYVFDFESLIAYSKK